MAMPPLRRPRPATLLLPILLAAGCSRGYNATPSAATARASLEKALAVWKEGGKPGEIAGSDPPIQVVDTPWQSGRKLDSFEVLREEAGDPDVRVSVLLKQADPPVEQEVQYHVIGKGPIWIYRDEDYQRLINMDNNPAPRPAPRSPRR
jgi:hypothetical protein